MAQLYIELAPQNGKDLFDTCGPHMADAADSYNRGMKKLFTQVFKDLEKMGLVLPKKEKVVEEVEKKEPSDDEIETPSRAAETETDASETGTPMPVCEPDANTEERKVEAEVLTKWQIKKNKQNAQRELDEKAEMEKEISDLIAQKEGIPPPRVMHDKEDLDVKDIWLPGVTIIAGSKELLVDATVKFTRGRKYGLIGRNGTGKTTLINTICRKEINNMP